MYASKKSKAPKKANKTKKRFNKRTVTKPPIGSRAIATNTYQKGYLPFGQSFHFKLPYSSTHLLASLATTLAETFSFNIGSCFDPQTSVGGHQPYQWDQISPMYSNYRCLKTKYEVTFSDPTIDGLWVGVHVRNPEGTTCNGQTLDYIRERRLTVMQPINNTGSQKKIFKADVELHKLYGETKVQWLNNAANKASVTGNPATTPILELVVLSPLGDIGTVTVNIRLIYEGVLTEPVTIAQS